MKGILKIYHPDEILKYHIQNTYCKAVYSNEKHFLEVEIITDESLDHVDDDSLQYNFPQLAMNVFDYPLENEMLEGKSFEIEDDADENFIQVDLFNNQDAYLSDCKLSFKSDSSGVLELFWEGEIDDFYTGSETALPFKLKCHFKQDEIFVDED